MKKLAIITTHPIQYYAPVFKLLHQRKQIDIKVFYTWGQASLQKYDPDFNRQVAWDIPLLDGYPYEWVENTSTDPGSHHRKGIINPHLNQQIKAYNPNAILVFGWAYRSHLNTLRYFHNKIPVYFRGDSTLLDETGGVKSIVKKLFLNWVYSHVDHAFYVGTNNRAYFKKYGLTDNQLSFAPHAVDNERFAVPQTAEANKLRASLGIKPGENLILFAGKLESKKSPQLLLDAFLLARLPNTQLLFVGNGSLEALLKEQSGANPNIHFIEFINQTYMPVVYQACNIFCLPSGGPNETWGLAVNEAMACSKPVLVSDKCGCAVDLVQETNGIIFKSGNIDELILGLRKLTEDQAKLAGMGHQSAGIISKWNFEVIAAAIEHQLINEKI